MEQKYLTLEQNLCAARIFLNTFGFILEEIEEVNEFSKIKICNKNMDEVGTLSFDNGKVNIIANYQESFLKASYDIAEISGTINQEFRGFSFAEWNSNINFHVINKNDILISGEFLITSSLDTEYGANAVIHPLIYIKDKNTNITLKILRNGLTFGLEIKDSEKDEKIEIRPWNELIGFYLHDISKDQYRKYAGVFNGGEVGVNKDRLHIFLKEDEKDEEIDLYNDFIDKEKDILLIQIGNKMKKLDASVFIKIKELKSILTIDDISILDNLISVCYDSYKDEEIEALLDLKREKMNYQDGSSTLIESYYGLNKKSFFLSDNGQKRLKKIKTT